MHHKPASSSGVGHACVCSVSAFDHPRPPHTPGDSPTFHVAHHLALRHTYSTTSHLRHLRPAASPLAGTEYLWTGFDPALDLPLGQVKPHASRFPQAVPHRPTAMLLLLVTFLSCRSDTPTQAHACVYAAAYPFPLFWKGNVLLHVSVGTHAGTMWIKGLA